ncbi:hypothetical protein PR048_015428 [Dryococelus australis]|uniref:TTF-type domain-containing protein n=1 Tax=Dryococelus australis TaxID=614101 RepID=A0ABQ9HH76_9NEOP|nr:hypothetical protein PR048_015428 [Dryococelus australis]
MWKYLQNVSKLPGKKLQIDDDKQCYDKKYDETIQRRNYQETWSVTFPWIRYDSDKNVMFCKTCEQFQEKTSQSSFITGCSSFRKENLSSHIVSQCHKLCAEIINSRNAEPGKSVEEKALQSLNKEVLEKMRIFFRNRYAIAKHERPFPDFKWLCEQDKKKSFDIGETYITDKKCAEFISFVGCVEQKKLEESPENNEEASFDKRNSTDLSADSRKHVVYVLVKCMESRLGDNYNHNFNSWPEALNADATFGDTKVFHKSKLGCCKRKNKAEYANILGLVDLLLSLPAYTADCERGFSLMKSTKSDWRNRLGDNVLSSLMRIQMKSPSVCDYDPDDAIKFWLHSSQRKCRPFQAPYAKGEMDVCPSESDSDED